MIDLKVLAQDVMEKAKENLVMSDELVPVVGFILPDDSCRMAILSFSSPEEKRLVYSCASQAARRLHATAVFLINDARYRKVMDGEDINNYYQGQGEVEQWAECIVVAIKVPGAKSFTIHLPYWKNREGVICFGEQTESSVCEFGMFPDW